MKPVVAQRASYFEKKHSWKEETVKQKGNFTVFSPLQKAGSQSPLEPTNGHQMSQKTSPNAQLSPTPHPQAKPAQGMPNDSRSQSVKQRSPQSKHL